ncbi:MAG: hypothetical protein H7A52_06510 [Akkermansiaceae bacterium]|nr:hypothetical protein [Akkermansiaceae bacterium]
MATTDLPAWILGSPRRHPEVVWSNPDADDSRQIRSALLSPRFHVLLDLALLHGLPRLRDEWAALEDDPLTETDRARSHIERIFRNITEGFHRAETGH